MNKELLINKTPGSRWPDIEASEESCQWMKDWFANSGGCVPSLSGNLTISGCDDSYDVPIKFCPGCGGEIELIDGPTEPRIETLWAKD